MNRRDLLLSASAATVLLGCGRPEAQSATGPLHFSLGATGKNGETAEELAARYRAETGVAVKLVEAPLNATERLNHYRQALAARESALDVMMIDVTWPGALGGRLHDLSASPGVDAAEFFPRMVANNTVAGRLVGLPWYADAGLLFYRADLLAEQGIDAPPATWDELEGQALAVQQAQRSKDNPAFWGFLWQGAPREGLVCAALEWQLMLGGGPLLDEQSPVARFDAEGLAATLRRAQGWISRISPPEVLAMQEEESAQRFLDGEAAFLRGWGYMWGTLRGGAELGRDIRAAALPAGPRGQTSTLGGWQLAVPAASARVEQAVQLAQWLASAESMRHRAQAGGFAPARPALYDDPAVRAALAFPDGMLDVLSRATPRPSRVAGTEYAALASLYIDCVHGALSGSATPEEAVARLMQGIAALWR